MFDSDQRDHYPIHWLLFNFFTTVTVSESLSVTDCLYGSRTMQFLHGFDILVCFQCFMIMIFH